MTKTTGRVFPAFKSAEGRARYLAAYDAALSDWPVPYEALTLKTRLGPTHVIASGPKDAPPLVLLGSLAASAMGWRLNVEGLSPAHRVPLRRRLRRLMGDKRPPDITDLRVRRPPRDEKWRALMSITMAEGAQLSLINAAVFSARELRRVRAPVLLLIGDGEVLYDPAATLALAKQRMPQIEGAIVPDADHIAAMAQPEDVNARILAFLAAA